MINLNLSAITSVIDLKLFQLLLALYSIYRNQKLYAIGGMYIDKNCIDKIHHF